LLALFIALLFVSSALPGMIQVHRTMANHPATLDTLPIDPAVLDEIIRESKTIPHRSLPTPLQVSALLNMPAMLVELPVDLATAWPSSWYPRLPFPFNDLWFWRAISWPIYALPLWWLAGRGLDAFLQDGRLPIKPRLRFVEVLFMGIIGLVSGVCGVGLFFTADSDDIRDGLRWIIVPGLLWFALGLMSVIAWIRQRRLNAAVA
jgi:hypothetical protein